MPFGGALRIPGGHRDRLRVPHRRLVDVITMPRSVPVPISQDIFLVAGCSKLGSFHRQLVRGRLRDIFLAAGCSKLGSFHLRCSGDYEGKSPAPVGMTALVWQSKNYPSARSKQCQAKCAMLEKKLS